MAKIEIDNKKMWESLRKAMWYFPEAEWLTRSIDTALSEQGLTVNDKGEITTIEPKVEWYVALNDYGHYDNTIIGAVPLFLKGERTTKENVFNMCKDIMGYEITEEEFNKNFRPATEEEIQQTSTKPHTPLEHQGAANDHVESKPEPKKCLFTKDLYTDEERKELCEGCQEECELNKHTELEDVLVNFIGNIDGDYCVHISSYDDYINKFAPQILAAARKLIASEIDATQMTREMSIKDLKTLTLGAAYYQGIVNTIKKIKGESV